jgi:hypothetical protein
VLSGDRLRARRLDRGAWCPDVQEQEPGEAARPDADGEVLEPGRVLDCYLDLVLDPVEDAEPAGVRNQGLQASKHLRDGPLGHHRSCRAYGDSPTRQVVALNGPRPAPEVSDGHQAKRVQDHEPLCHPRAIHTGLGWFLAVSHGHSRHADLH